MTKIWPMRKSVQMNVHVKSRFNSLLSLAVAIFVAVFADTSVAGSLEKAKRIHDRLTGVPPSASVLADMQSDIAGGNAINAAYRAMNNSAFYNATLKNWASPWTNRDSNKFAPLNDYTATVIGLVRDSVDYRQVLFGDIVYVGENGVVPAPYSNSNNTHYEQLEANGIDLGDDTKLVPRNQSTVTGLPVEATAGVMTTRAAARAFFIDGTNRAMFRFTLKNHLCNDMEQVQDTTRPADRIRQDVSRSPGGDSRLFMNGCVGCHSGMDPMAQAFAYYNFNYDKNASDQDAAKDAGQIQYTAGTVQPKYFINANHFNEGFVTPDDRWDNYWRAGPNTAIFGWSSPNSGIVGGNGAKSMGQELANSEAFAVCSVKKVFQAVCLRDPASGDQTAFATMVGNLKSNNYDLKHTFAEAAVHCSGN